MSYREVAGAPHMFNEFIDHNKSGLHNPFLNPQPINPHPVYIPRPMPRLAGHPAQLAGNPNGFGELGTFSKLAKYAWLVLVGGSFIGAKVMLAKHSAAIEQLSRQSPEFGKALEELKGVHLPVTILLAVGPAFQLLVNRDWPMLTYAGIAGGVGYTAFKAGPSVLSVATEAKQIAAITRKRKRRKRK